MTYPLDIVRTRLSIQSASFAELVERKAGEKLPGMFETMVIMYRNEGGIPSLYRGLIPTVAGVAPYVSPGTWDLTPTRSFIDMVGTGGTEFHGV